MKKLIILAALGLVMLGGSGTAAWYFLLREDPDAVVERAPKPPERIFVDLDPMVLAVMRDGHAVRHLTFMIILEVDNLTHRNRVVQANLRLRDAYRHELHALYSRRIMQNRDDAMPVVSKRLMRVSDQVLGDGVVQKVLINVMTNRELQIG